MLKTNKAMACATDSSDSEEENLDLFKEAANNEFFSDSLFNNAKEANDHQGKNNASSTSCKVPQVSLRQQCDTSDKQISGLHVTPEFQNFVGKHLAKMLDGQLKEKRKKLKKNVAVNIEPVGGIKLFSNSKHFVSAEESTSSETQTPGRKRRRKKSKSSDSESEQLKFAEAAVTTQWVLQKEGTKGWTNKVKGKEIRIDIAGSIVSGQD